MHLTEIGVIFLLERSKFSEKMLMIFLALCFSRAGDTGGEGGGGEVLGAMPLLYRTLPENCFCRVIKNVEHIKSV